MSGLCIAVFYLMLEERWLKRRNEKRTKISADNFLLAGDEPS
jgi:hypothetical protein